MVAVRKVESVEEKFANVEAKALIDTLTNTIVQIQMQTLG